MITWNRIVKEQKEQIDSWTLLCEIYRESLYQGE
jgi:hypothetical protein